MDQDIKTVIQYPTGDSEYDIPFDYLSRKFVRVSLVGDNSRVILSNVTDYRYVSKTRIKLLADATGYGRIELRRFTSASERVVDFSDGSVLRANDLNISATQAGHIAEEARDSALMALSLDDLGNFDVGGIRLTNVGEPTVSSDAATKGYVDRELLDSDGRSLMIEGGTIGKIRGDRALRQLGFDKEGNPVLITALPATELEVLLASTSGAEHIGHHDSTVGSILDSVVVLTQYGEAVIGGDSTEAFKKAYTSGKPVYVPEGDWWTSVFIPSMTFGPGRVRSNYTSDRMFNDSGRRVIPPFYRGADEPVWFNANTRGNYERGGALSVTMNMPGERPQIMGFQNDSRQATYTNHDAVGMYIGASGPQNQHLLSDCIFTANSVESPDITEEVVGDVEAGMFLRTTTLDFGARVLAVSLGRIEVSGWYKAGNSSEGQVPPNGTGVMTNSVTKAWGQNTVVFCTDKSSTNTFTGYELGFQLSKQPGLCWGFDAANYSDVNTGDRALLARGKWRAGLYIDGRVGTGVQRIIDGRTSEGAPGVEVQNLNGPQWKGQALLVNTNYRSDDSSVVLVRSGVTDYWKISTSGKMSALRLPALVTSSSMTINTLGRSIYLCNNSEAITLTVDPSSAVASQLFFVSAVGSAPVNVVVRDSSQSARVVPARGSATFYYDGNFLNQVGGESIGIATEIQATIRVNGSSPNKVRYVGAVDSTVEFDTSNMVQGQEWKILNSSQKTVTIPGGTLQPGGSAEFWFVGSGGIVRYK